MTLYQHERACGCFCIDAYPYAHYDKHPACKQAMLVEYNWHTNLGRGFEDVGRLMTNGDRMMQCGYGGNRRPSNPDAAFFKSLPDSDEDEYYCGCYGWD